MSPYAHGHEPNAQYWYPDGGPKAEVVQQVSARSLFDAIDRNRIEYGRLQALVPERATKLPCGLHVYQLFDQRTGKSGFGVYVEGMEAPSFQELEQEDIEELLRMRKHYDQWRNT